jgi:hypothetical protein
MTEDDYLAAWEYACDDTWGEPIRRMVQEFSQKIYEYRAKQFWERILGQLPHLFPIDEPMPELDSGSMFRITASLRPEGHLGHYVSPERPQWTIEKYQVKLTLDNGEHIELDLRGVQESEVMDGPDTWRTFAAGRVVLVRWWATGELFRRIVDTRGGVDALYGAVVESIAGVTPAMRDTPHILDSIRDYIASFSVGGGPGAAPSAGAAGDAAPPLSPPINR